MRGLNGHFVGPLLSEREREKNASNEQTMKMYNTVSRFLSGKVEREARGRGWSVGGLYGGLTLLLFILSWFKATQSAGAHAH